MPLTAPVVVVCACATIPLPATMAAAVKPSRVRIRFIETPFGGKAAEPQGAGAKPAICGYRKGKANPPQYLRRRWCEIGGQPKIGGECRKNRPGSKNITNNFDLEYEP